MNTKKIVVYLIIILFSYNLLAQEVSSNNTKSVLLLFSGSHEFLVNRELFMAFEKELQPNNIKLISDYLGDNNSVHLRNKKVFLEFFTEKYGKYRKFDLVIAFNKKAIELCRDYGHDIFPDTDILNLDILSGKSFTPSVSSLLDAINNLHKGLENIIIVSDNSNRGKILKNHVQTYIDSTMMFKEQVIYMDFSKMKYSEISKYEYYSKRKCVVVLLSAYQDASLNKKEHYEQIEFLEEELGLPIYTFYEKDEAKAIGGYYYDIKMLANHLSTKIMLILNNMPMDKMSFTTKGIFQLYFNQDVAKKYNIDLQPYKSKAVIDYDQEEMIFRLISHNTIKHIVQVIFIITLTILIFNIYKKGKYKNELENLKNVISDISNKLPQYILVIDAKTGEITDYNQKVAKSEFRDFIIKKETKITDFFPDEIMEILSEENENYHSLTHELEFSTKKGAFPALLATLNFKEKGKELSLIQFINNSAYKQEIHKLKKMKENAEQKVTESTNLISGFIREIRNPLNVKRGFENIIRENDLDSLMKEKYLKIIQTNSNKLLKLMEKILVFSELDNNTRILNNQEFSVNTVIRDIIESYQKEIRESQNDIKIVNYFSLSDQKDILFNDKEYFCIIFNELLGNAIKYTQQGVIECGYTHPSDGKIIFYVKDNGIGMTSDEQHSAFNKFNNLSEASSKIDKTGIGIGLAICRSMISKMGGNIWLTSGQNKGTTVYFYLDFDMSVFNKSQNTLHQSDINKLSQKKILIIDEDLGSQKYFNKILKKYDIKGKLIPNYQLYLKYNLHEQHFDYIIIDYDSGFKEFYESNISMLKEQNVALIILTQNILEERITQELKEINYSIIYKPLKFKDVINSLLKF